MWVWVWVWVWVVPRYEGFRADKVTRMDSGEHFSSPLAIRSHDHDADTDRAEGPEGRLDSPSLGLINLLIALHETTVVL